MIRRFFLKKLVRSKFIDECVKNKYTISYEKMKDERFEKELFLKLLEESNEVVSAKNHDELLLEIADVYEVLDEILKLKKISKDELANARNEKKEKRGSLDERLFVDYIEFKKDCFYTKYFEENKKYEKHELTMHVVGFLIENEGKIFIQKRSPNSKHFPSQWEIPGGKVEVDDEQVEECLKRELKEELNLDLVEIKEKIFDEILFEPSLGKHSYTVFLITAEGDLKLEEGKATEFKWIDKSEVELLNVKTRQINPVYDIVKKFLNR